MNSQNKLPTTYCPVAFLNICLNFWSITDAVVKSLVCCIKPVFWWNLDTTEGTEIFFNLMSIMLSLSYISLCRWVQAMLLKNLLCFSDRLGSHHSG